MSKHPFELSQTELESIDLNSPAEIDDQDLEKVSGGFKMTTYAVGEEGGRKRKRPRYTTLALGEEGGRRFPIFRKIKWFFRK